MKGPPTDSDRQPKNNNDLSTRSPSMITPDGAVHHPSNGSNGTSRKISSEVMRAQTNDPLVSKAEVRRVQLKDLRGALGRSTMGMDFVTQEQIARVRQMHDLIADGAVSHFNYNTLLLVASVLAGLGLASGSTTTVIASMLVSPIMGPVVGIAYGRTIGDKQLVFDAVKTELLSLVFCILVGACLGLTMGWTDMAKKWPTQEMINRCTWENFFVGLPIAFFSGLGVAVSLLDEQTNSLVGVAISASLLPPAVNAGMVWVAYGFFDRNRNADYYADVDDDFIHTVTKEDFRLGGVVSLLLTLANILLVVVASMLMFRLKEKLPIRKKVFWEDLRVARLIYQDRAFLVEDENNNDGSNPMNNNNNNNTIIVNNDQENPMITKSTSPESSVAETHMVVMEPMSDEASSTDGDEGGNMVVLNPN